MPRGLSWSRWPPNPDPDPDADPDPGPEQVGLASGEGACSLESGVIQTMAMGSVVRLIMLPISPLHLR